MVVPKFLAKNGPSGTYSHFWMSRANQLWLFYFVTQNIKIVGLYKKRRTTPIVHEDLNAKEIIWILCTIICVCWIGIDPHTIPKMCWSAWSTVTGSPSWLPLPTKKAVSNSKSKSLHLSNIGGSVSLGLVWPIGRRTGVPETTIDEDRPWYPTGKYFQLGISAFSLPLFYIISLLLTKKWKRKSEIPKHLSNIGCMDNWWVKICVITNFGWQVHGCFRL